MTSTTPEFTATDRRAVVAVAAQFFVNGALFASFAPRLPEIRDRVGIDVDRLGLLLSIAGLIGLMGSVASGWLVDRFGTRSVMTAAGVILACSLPLIGYATAPLVLVLGLILINTFDVLVDVPMNMQGSWLSARRHTPIINRLHGLWSLGTVIGGASSSWLAARGVSLQTHLLVAGIVLLVVILAVSQNLLETDEVHAEADMVGDDHGTRRRVWMSPTLVLFFFGGLFAVGLEVGAMNWAAFRFTDDFETSAAFGALGFVAFSLGMTIARFAGDAVLHRLGDQRLQDLSLLLCAIGFTAATVIPQRHVSMAGYAIAGLGVAALIPKLYDLAAKSRGRAGSGLGALTAGMRLSTLGLPIAVGWLASTNLSMGTALAIALLPAVLGHFVVGQQLKRQQAA